jgi:hypothetical protein
VKLWKTTIVIWSDFNPKTVEIDRLAREAIDGAAYCVKQESKLVEDLDDDEDWDGTDFFDNPDESYASEN